MKFELFLLFSCFKKSLWAGYDNTFSPTNQKAEVEAVARYISVSSMRSLVYSELQTSQDKIMRLSFKNKPWLTLISKTMLTSQYVSSQNL